ncbi:hypothetical protein QR680_010047 [Steinernema hermaphroditum]|uniref:7TM GPCR serpentine receptor class x (Srx) domain-containing protein n=1 Tax=Steinernema hermaphroditum TaxID=289476 RepID=A0AA39MB19_9BILA|nr:hypothetical protein QR680_010047 [Steinernema hermaphroditum]
MSQPNISNTSNDSALPPPLTFTGPVQFFQGIALFIIVSIGTPAYLRIIYIFISTPSYRKRECYRIMIQIGIVQCLFAPGTFFQALMQVIDRDPFGLATVAIRLMPPVVRVEAIMSLVLALNRLKIICRIKYPALVHNVILVCAWIFGALFFISYFIFTDLYYYYIFPGSLNPLYDYSKPLSYVFRISVNYLLIGTSSITFTVYVAIISYLAYLRRTCGNTMETREKAILTFACTKFVVDVFLALSCMFFPYSTNLICQIYLSMGHQFNSLILAPVLYLTLQSELRAEFFRLRSTSTKISVLSGSK